MIVLTSHTAATYKAQIRSSLEKGFKPLYSATCTMGEEQAARAVVAKWFSAAAADSVALMKDPAEIEAAVGDFFRDPQRKQVFTLWSFNPSAKNPAPASTTMPASAATPAVIDGKAQLVPATDLDATAAALAKLEETVREIQTRAEAAKIPFKVKQGFHLYRAHLHFAVNPGKGGRPKKPSRRDGLADPASFEGWLAQAAPTIKKGAAYKYMSAFRGLGLGDDATEAEVDAAIAALVNPTIKALADAAVDRLGPPPESPPAPAQQLSFDDYLATLKTFREDSELVIEQAKEMPDHLRKAAAARAYATLHALTGTAWQPADEHDELGTIDPDSITL